MTPSIINEIHKEPDRMSSTRSSSLPENMLNIRSSSLPKNLPNTMSLPANLLNTNSTPLPTNFPNKRSASLPSILPNSSSLSSFINNERSNNNDEIIISSIKEKNSRRYATYDLNWINTDDHIDLENSVNPIIIPTSSTSLIQEDFFPSSPPIISSPISPIVEINNDYDYSDNEEKYSFPGGITVTTVKVVQIDERTSLNRSSKIPLPKNKIIYKNEINNTYNIFKNQITIKKQKKSTTDNNNNNNNNILSQTIKERRKTRIYNNVEQDNIAQFKILNNHNERKFNNVVRRSSSRRKLGVQYKKSYKKRQFQSQERMIPAPTSNPFYTNDPTDMEGDDVILSPTTKGFPWLPVPNGPPKLLHASLVPLSQFIKNIETTTTSDVPHSKSKRKSVESMSAPKPKRPSQLFRQNLLEQSIALSFNEMAMRSFASQPTQITQIAKSTQSVQSLHKSKRKTVESISAPKPKRPSQLFRENLLEQSVAMSFNEKAMGRNVLTSRSTQSTQSTRSTRKLDVEQIESISEPQPKRPSQLFRENLLEQSVAMSLDEVIMGRNVFATNRQSLNSKIPRRRFSRRGSNAKFRNEKSEKNKKGKNKKDDGSNQREQIKQETINPMVISNILEADELKTKVEEQLRKRAVLQSPQPPPRRLTPSTSTTDSRREVIVRRRSKSTKLEKRLIKPEPSSYRDSVQPFPNHLAKRNKSMRWH
ncbi:hypothetical protein GLOIN_2v1595492 [Rhizophagus irregularis DAOM 181602=DAOM 197198]|uniref:Uncharacterized protein n=2 Tax=Rhizophagus irregularis TaxID=588596 RepID=A0A015I2Q8_RHIIW|nr:hypothetical protein GLOIN_2v1595492 [Rhizophagus irregularis DAOM 181602=DAOM 197198]EXX51282.1 hypothetical protein RirG_263320 [Rhizophagus irregularis DAOM 197198w]EXX51283.1 hypothetical protein RirG_263320 [Rhizophagus irregularis DAOM 197198w]POG72469.1 hypothetical protein GLOIN_2v1595492 [Rhizophagus irregularis DAOM 181602=DAOM 197198]|eukprot:XP_025179335.1 hypothetical protein GLOIN_2v1595492 [Rhizophagus irregularis DAOM 181602=DAOM 197198]